jgi:gliding motility-associated-like protein
MAYLLFTMKHKIFITLTLLYLLFSNNAIAQRYCIDTLGSISLYNEDFGSYVSGFSTPLLCSDSSTIYQYDKYLIKQNKNKALLWKKKINKLDGTKFLQSGNRIIVHFDYINPATEIRDYGIAKISSSGNILWSKKINYTNENLIQNFQKGKNDDLVSINRFVSSSATYSDGFTIAILDSNANNFRLHKSYQHILGANESFDASHINFTLDSNFIYVAFPTTITQSSPTRLTGYLVVVKIDYNTGAIVNKVKYGFNDIVTVTGGTIVQYNYIAKGVLTGLNMKIANDKIYINGGKNTGYTDCNRTFAIKLDTNLNIITNKIYRHNVNSELLEPNTTSIYGGVYDDNGNILFTSIQDSIYTKPPSTYYFFTDTALKIIIQRRQAISETGLSGFSDNRFIIPYLKNKGTGNIIYVPGPNGLDSLIHIVDIAKDIISNNCMGVDEINFITEAPTYSTLPSPNFIVTTPAPILLTNYNLTSTDVPMEVRKFCSQTSICDSLKIRGNTNFCITAPNATFSFYKNPQCLRKVSWLVDTAFIKIINKPNDSTITVQFLQPFHGYIKAEVDGCVVKDSLYVDVNTPMQGLNLGKDTMYCPGKKILLNVGVGFKTYKWQDNSTNPTYLATLPGTYFVIVTDSCNNIFRDTIIIKPMDVNFNLQYPNSICLYDTAIVSLPAKMFNYLWNPTGSAFIENSIIKFFPENTTLYTVTADRFVGCVLTDTINIKVLNCPIYFYVPSAFTPNNDNLNDVFKPIVSGKIELYQFSVFNRFGQIVFNSTKNNESWSGKFNGILQDIGTFTWTCYYKLKNQNPILKKGTVLLLK